MSTLHHEDMLLDIFEEVQENFPYLDEDKQIEIANQRFEDLLQWTTTKSLNAIMELMTFTHQLHLNLVWWMTSTINFFTITPMKKILKNLKLKAILKQQFPTKKVTITDNNDGSQTIFLQLA